MFLWTSMWTIWWQWQLNFWFLICESAYRWLLLISKLGKVDVKLLHFVCVCFSFQHLGKLMINWFRINYFSIKSDFRYVPLPLICSVRTYMRLQNVVACCTTRNLLASKVIRQQLRLRSEYAQSFFLLKIHVLCVSVCVCVRGMMMVPLTSLFSCWACVQMSLKRWHTHIASSQPPVIAICFILLAWPALK